MTRRRRNTGCDSGLPILGMCDAGKNQGFFIPLSDSRIYADASVVETEKWMLRRI